MWRDLLLLCTRRSDDNLSKHVNVSDFQKTLENFLTNSMTITLAALMVLTAMLLTIHSSRMLLHAE
jgi:preprotein translocase subunit SecG